jgi:peptide/nickel transport system substrate-binding protein
MTLTLTLRDDVKFTDGTAFNAEAAAQNLIRFRDGASPNKSLLRSVADAKASDAKTVAITMKQPDPALLIALTQNAGLQESPGVHGERSADKASAQISCDTAKTVVGTEYYFTKYGLLGRGQPS